MADTTCQPDGPATPAAPGIATGTTPSNVTATTTPASSPPATGTTPTVVVQPTSPNVPVNVTVTGSTAQSASDATAQAGAAAAAGNTTPPPARPADPTLPPLPPGQEFPQTFVAAVSLAPDDGATISGVVRLAIAGDNIANAELLPPVGYEPKYAIFRQEMPTRFLDVDWDTTKLPNGPISVRISAFDHPAGDPRAQEIVAMQVRTWIIQNQPKLITLADLPYVDPGPLISLVNLPDPLLQDRLTNHWPETEDLLHKYIPAGVDFAPGVPLGFYGPWKSCLTQHGLLACREHMSQLISLENSKAPK
jgi:hypothetical protein